MGDLISREAALACFHDWVDKYGDVHSADEMPEYRAIEALPSIEPNTAENGSISCTNAEKMYDRPTDDLISRQAAIDDLDTLWDVDTIDGITASTVLKQVRTDILNLPSAQPITCGEWIPCSERLPMRNGDYLVTGRYGAVNKRKYEDGRWYGNWVVTAWMPLPEPYNGADMRGE